MKNKTEIDALNAGYNPKHKYAVHDMNGLPRFTATTLECARRRARYWAEKSGLDMQICYRDFRVNHILWVRTHSPNRHISLNGTWVDARR
jgi:hypothetical protein